MDLKIFEDASIKTNFKYVYLYIYLIFPEVSFLFSILMLPWFINNSSNILTSLQFVFWNLRNYISKWRSLLYGILCKQKIFYLNYHLIWCHYSFSNKQILLGGQVGAEKPSGKDMFYYRKQLFIYCFYNT